MTQDRLLKLLFVILAMVVAYLLAFGITNTLLVGILVCVLV